MKKLITLVIGLLAWQMVQAQGTVYLSNLNGLLYGYSPIASNCWSAVWFNTGPNAGGYMLDSVQLALNDASGNPSGFKAMIYSMVTNLPYGPPGPPDSMLAILDGSENPSTNGIYTYTSLSSLVLSPSTDYYIVLTADTPISSPIFFDNSPAGASQTGCYSWKFTSFGFDSSGGWSSASPLIVSTNGLSWRGLPFGTPQFAVTATPIPEPDIFGLLGLGGLFFIRRYRRAKPALM